MVSDLIIDLMHEGNSRDSIFCILEIHTLGYDLKIESASGLRSEP
jgi:hypothetical protein